MSKEEILKIQKCVLKVNIHCDGCKQKVKKILQKIDGVFTTEIDADQGKVTVSGNVDPAILIKKLAKSGKHAEIWGAQKGNQQNLGNQMKNMQIDNGKNGKQALKGVNNGNNQPKVGNNQLKNGGGLPPMQNLQQQQLQQQQLQQHLQHLQQLQQVKGLPDLKLPPQFKDLKMPSKDPNPNQKTVKFNLHDDGGDLSDYDDDDDDYDDDYDDDDDDLEDEMDDVHLPSNKMKPFMGNGPGGNMINGSQLLNAQKNGNQGGGAKKGSGGGGGGGAVPVLLNGMGGGNGQNQGGNGGKKGGGGGGNNQNQGGGGKNGVKPGEAAKGGNNDGVSNNKNGNNGGGGNATNNNNNGGKKAGGVSDVQAMKMGGGAAHGGLPGGHFGQMGSMPMGQMGNIPRGPMGNMPAVQGLPASGMNGGGGYFHGGGPEAMAGNPYHQQQMLAAMMNQQQAMANNQPMMYARPPPAVNYMPPPYPYPYPHPPPADQYSHFFSDENTSSCNVM